MRRKTVKFSQLNLGHEFTRWSKQLFNMLRTFFILSCAVFTVALCAGPKFAPYYDVILKPSPSLPEIIQKTGQKAFHLAFALGSHAGCEPAWGAEKPINSSEVMDGIREAQKLGAEFIIATGGALGPYLEHLCTTVDSLVGAYRKVLDTVGTNHLDVDVEAPINLDIVNKALAQLQRERPDVTVSFTLPVQGDDYGLTDALGTSVLKSAKANGVRVDIVNAMTMEYPSSLSFGDSVIAAGNAVVSQMKVIWPEKSETELRGMLGITPMIGRNMNSRVFETEHARQLVNWANQNPVGLLSFWSVGRDNGGCAGGAVSPYCSSIAQGEYEFTSIYKGFRG